MNRCRSVLLCFVIPCMEKWSGLADRFILGRYRNLSEVRIYSVAYTIENGAHAPAQAVSGRVFNIATNSQITLNQAASILPELTGYNKGEGSGHGPERTGDIVSVRPDQVG